MIKRKPWHKGFRRKTYEEVIEAENKKRRDKPPKPINKKSKGRLRSQKDIWNAEWKDEMRHVKWCESCGRPETSDPDSKLTMMHALKQRFITTREDCRRAAKVCWGEHRRYDFATGPDVHAKMAAFVDALIAKRPGWKG